MHDQQDTYMFQQCMSAVVQPYNAGVGEGADVYTECSYMITVPIAHLKASLSTDKALNWLESCYFCVALKIFEWQLVQR